MSFLNNFKTKVNKSKKWLFLEVFTIKDKYVIQDQQRDQFHIYGQTATHCMLLNFLQLMKGLVKHSFQKVKY
jgi:hypothetical protein